MVAQAVAVAVVDDLRGLGLGQLQALDRALDAPLAARDQLHVDRVGAPAGTAAAARPDQHPRGPGAPASVTLA